MPEEKQEWLSFLFLQAGTSAELELLLHFLQSRSVLITAQEKPEPSASLNPKKHLSLALSGRGTAPMWEVAVLTCPVSVHALLVLQVRVFPARESKAYEPWQLNASLRTHSLCCCQPLEHQQGNTGWGQAVLAYLLSAQKTLSLNCASTCCLPACPATLFSTAPHTRKDPRALAR